MGKFVVSPSQLSDWRLCRRKWWLTKVAKAVRVDRGYFDFGVVLHAVVERWLRADERGVDPATGQPVDLYPPGWEAAGDSGLALTIPEQDLIRRLVDKAVAEGVLRRLPGREVEVAMRRVLVEGDPDGGPIELWGVVDFLTPEGIEDHKTVGNWRYALSTAQLAEDPQVLTYAMELLLRRAEAGLPDPERIYVRHNQFSKDLDDPRVRSVEAWVTPERVRAEWARAASDAECMRADRAFGKWHDVPSPTVGSDACRKYGGCDFLTICSGQRSVEQHNELTASANRDRLRGKARTSTRSNNGMGALADVMRARIAAQQAAEGLKSTTVAVAAPPPPVNSGQAAPVAAPAPSAAPSAAPGGPAPWYTPGCPACTTNQTPGITTSGIPCRVCDSRTRTAGGPSSDAYDLVYDAQRHVVGWSPKAGSNAGAVGGSAPVPGSEKPVAVKQVVQVPTPAETTESTPSEKAPPREKTPAAPGFDPPAAPEADGDEDGDEPAVAAGDSGEAVPRSARKAGRPAQGATLSFVPVRGVSRVYYLSQLIRPVVEQIAADKANWKSGEATHYLEMDVWARRDLLARNAEAMIEYVNREGPAVIVVDVSANDPEWRSLVDRLTILCRRQFGMRSS